MLATPPFTATDNSDARTCRGRRSCPCLSSRVGVLISDCRARSRIVPMVPRERACSWPELVVATIRVRGSAALQCAGNNRGTKGCAKLTCRAFRQGPHVVLFAVRVEFFAGSRFAMLVLCHILLYVAKHTVIVRRVQRGYSRTNRVPTLQSR